MKKEDKDNILNETKQGDLITQFSCPDCFCSVLKVLFVNKTTASFYMRCLNCDNVFAYRLNPTKFYFEEEE